MSVLQFSLFHDLGSGKVKGKVSGGMFPEVYPRGPYVPTSVRRYTRSGLSSRTQERSRGKPLNVT